jgi:hypothetical protein
MRRQPFILGIFFSMLISTVNQKLNGNITTPTSDKHEIRLKRVAQETLVPELECFVRKKKKNKISN